MEISPGATVVPAADLNANEDANELEKAMRGFGEFH